MLIVLKKAASKKEMGLIHSKVHNAKGVNTKKYCGAINLDEDPLVIQQKMRQEWENR